MIHTLCAQEGLEFFLLGDLAAYFEKHLNYLQDKHNNLLDFLAPMDVATGQAESLRNIIASGHQSLDSSERNLAIIMAFLGSQKSSRRAFELNAPTMVAWNLIRPFFPLWGNHLIYTPAKPLQVQGRQDVYIALLLELLLRAWRMTRNGGDIQLQVESQDDRVRLGLNIFCPEVTDRSAVSELTADLRPAQNELSGIEIVRRSIALLNGQLTTSIIARDDISEEDDQHYQPVQVQITGQLHRAGRGR